jgi:hypothetical protein
VKTKYARIHDYIAGMNGIANGKTGTQRIVGDFRYHNFTLYTFIAGVLSDPTTVIDRIKLFVGPKQTLMFDAQPATLIKESKMSGIVPGTGECPINFTDIDPMKTRREAELTSWDLHGQGDMTMKVTFLNPGGGAVDCKVAGEWDDVENKDSKGNRRLLIQKRLQIDEVLPAGAKEVTDIDTSAPIQRLYLTPSAGVINDVLITLDGQIQLQRTKAENANDLNKVGFDATQFEFPIRFDKDHNPLSRISGRKLSLRQNSSLANTTSIHAVYLVNQFK